MQYILFYCKCRKRAKIVYHLVINHLSKVPSVVHCLIIRQSRLIIRQIFDIDQ